MKKSKLPISVIIRCRNEERWIGHSIQSVLDKFENPEILVIDNDSNDESMEIVNLFNFEDIKILKLDAYTPGKAINYGVNEAKNSMILVLSSHCVIENIDVDYVKNSLENFCAVAGKQIPIYKGKRFTPRYVWANFGDKEEVNYFSDAENRYFLHNAFCFYDQKFLMDNPFDEKLPGKEDRYWAIDMIENKKGKTLYSPDLIAFHYWTPNGATWKIGD